MSAIKVCNLEEVPDGTHRGFEAGGLKILLVRFGDQVFAYEDTCPHAGGPLSEGQMRQGQITCPLHRWMFDLRTGEGTRPKGKKMRAFTVTVTDGQIFVEPPGV
jgi:nitrite reductase/ring-hydroxylating ferredoxin subunit